MMRAMFLCKFGLTDNKEIQFNSIQIVTGIHDILLSYILISYLIYLEKSKTMVPFTHSF